LLTAALDTPGPMTRSVEDAAILFNLLQGADPLDPATLRHRPDDPMPTLRRGVAGLRLAILPQEERAGVNAEVLAAFDSFVETLKNLGAKIIQIVLPRQFSDFVALTGRVIGGEGYNAVAIVIRRVRQ
jgi:aspartyl-tRNA(Asn)/glutamyl-tRNA(Gln) amidotransferase subunit A